jgi:hypothetical protein
MAIIKRHGVTIDTGLHTDMDTVAVILVFRTHGRHGKMAVFTPTKEPLIIEKAAYLHKLHRTERRRNRAVAPKGTAVVYLMGNKGTIMVSATNPLFEAYVKHIIVQTAKTLHGRDWTSETTMAKVANVVRDKGLAASGIDMSNPPRGMVKALREVKAKAKVIVPPKPLPYGLLDT